MTTENAGAQSGATSENNGSNQNAGGNNGSQTGVPSVAWLPGADTDTVAYVGSKGWDKSANPAEAIFNSYRNLEKLWGADKAGNTVMLPGDTADQKTKDTFFNRLGRPETADKYSLKPDQVTGMPKETAESLLKLAHEQGLTDKQLAAIGKWNNDTAKTFGERLESDATVQLGQQQTKLKGEWGAAYDQNIQMAKEAATKLGWTAEQVNAMQLGLGFDGVMKLAHQLGVQVGEGKFVQTDGGRNSGQPGVLTPEQAKKSLADLTKDAVFMKEWTDKMNPNHAAAVAKKAQLTKWAHPG